MCTSEYHLKKQQYELKDEYIKHVLDVGSLKYAIEKKAANKRTKNILRTIKMKILISGYTLSHRKMNKDIRPEVCRLDGNANVEESGIIRQTGWQEKDQQNSLEIVNHGQDDLRKTSEQMDRIMNMNITRELISYKLQS